MASDELRRIASGGLFQARGPSTAKARIAVVGDQAIFTARCYATFDQ